MPIALMIRQVFTESRRIASPTMVTGLLKIGIDNSSASPAEPTIMMYFHSGSPSDTMKSNAPR